MEETGGNSLAPKNTKISLSGSVHEFRLMKVGGIGDIGEGMLLCKCDTGSIISCVAQQFKSEPK